MCEPFLNQEMVLGRKIKFKTKMGTGQSINLTETWKHLGLFNSNPAYIYL